MTFSDKKLDSLCWPQEEMDLDDVPNYAADFETTTKADDCRVWAWATCEVGKIANKQYGNSLETFIEWCKVHSGSRVYFHNLKFDGKFILSYMLQNGWRWIPVKTECDEKTFTTLISDMGVFYSIKIWFDSITCIEFLDSLKIIPLPVAAIPKAFGLKESKLELDYDSEREVGHELTSHEIDYITNDIVIPAKALEIMFDQGLKRMTTGSNAFREYQKQIGGKLRFRDWFPEPNYDKDLREGGCYKGGFTAINPKFIDKTVGEGISFDVNSLYPSVMASAHGEILPFDDPVIFEGQYETDEDYPIFIQFIEADFKIKQDHIPCIQLKGNSMFGETEYIRDSKGLQTLCLTSVDLSLLFEQYDIYDIRYLRGYKFRGSTELFKDYVDKWTQVKTQASIDKNDGMRTIAKLMLNSLYGKMATNPIRQSKRPYYDEGIVKYSLLPEEYGEAIYLPVGAFITSYARSFTVAAAQNNYDRWIYSDTDSNYFVGNEPPKNMEIHDLKLGAWKQEHHFSKFKGLRAKTYMFKEGDETIIHCAGMPTRCHNNVNFENFTFGSSFAGKLKPKDVKGGTILIDDVFTINE